MKERSSPWLYQWTPDPFSPGTCGEAILQVAPSSFGFWGTTASRQHTGDHSPHDAMAVKDYSHPRAVFPMEVRKAQDQSLSWPMTGGG